jgi:hypothetical protein
MTDDRNSPLADGARLSVCLPTDNIETLRPVLARLRTQTIASSIEVVIATPEVAATRAAVANHSAFASVRVVEVDALVPLGRARAAAVRAATSPFVFLGETHSFAEPEWAETLVSRHEEGWSVVVPGIVNANPRSVLSWAGLLLDDGGWLQDRSPREIRYWPLNNSSCLRAALLECGDDLERGLSYGDQPLLAPRQRRHRVYFEPRAVLSHLNISRFRFWLDERWVGGVLVARHRSRDWSDAKRVAYVLGSPLIPLVLFGRVARSAVATVRARRLPLATLPVMLLGAVAHGLGELAGYVRFGSVDEAEARITEYEIHKTRYARASARVRESMRAVRRHRVRHDLVLDTPSDSSAIG